MPVSVSASVEVSGADAVERALAYLETYRELYRLNDPRSELHLVRFRQEGGRDHVFFGQHYGGTAVFGAELGVHLRGNVVIGTSGRWLAAPPAAMSPRFEASRATVLALAAAGVRNGRAVGRPVLVHHARELLEPSASGARPEPSANGARLAWQVAVVGALASTGAKGAFTVHVDARDGRALLVQDEIRRHAFTLVQSTFDATDDVTTDCARGRALPPDEPSVVRVTPLANGTVDYFHRHFAIHSWDDTGAVQLGMHWDHDNAAYDPSCNEILFDDDYLVLDVFAHEFTHGVSNRLGPGRTLPRSLAVAESFSDVFAALVEGEWIHGEDVPGSRPRSLEDPTRFGDYDAMPTGFDPSDAYRLAGVLNKAAYLIAEGGTHRGIAVTGLGTEKTGQLYYAVLVGSLGRGSDMADVRDLTVLQAQQFVAARQFGFTPADACAVNDAFAAVALGDRCGDPRVDADGDHIPDDVDNCAPPIANPWQADGDSDGSGDACDLDDDGDGVDEDGDRSGREGDRPCRAGATVGCDDNCPQQPNVTQAGRFRRRRSWRPVRGQ
jgi:thermolysin